MSDQRSEKEKKGGVSRQRELHTHGTSDMRHPRRGVAHTPSSRTLGGGLGLATERSRGVQANFHSSVVGVFRRFPSTHCARRVFCGKSTASFWVNAEQSGRGGGAANIPSNNLLECMPTTSQRGGLGPFKSARLNIQ